MVACAIEPRMSWAKSFLSKPMEAFISSMIASGPEAKRPPHIWLEDIASFVPSAMMPALECFMTNKRPFGLPSAKLNVIAGLAGLIAGAVAVYVRNAGSGTAGPGGVEIGRAHV